MIRRNPNQYQMMKLWNHVAGFIEKHSISGEEAVHQCDDVILNAYDFISEAGNIVGWFEEEDPQTRELREEIEAEEHDEFVREMRIEAFIQNGGQDNEAD